MNSFARLLEITYMHWWIFRSTWRVAGAEGMLWWRCSHVKGLAGNMSITLKVRLLSRCRTHLMTANNTGECPSSLAGAALWVQHIKDQFSWSSRVLWLMTPLRAITFIFIEPFPISRPKFYKSPRYVCFLYRLSSPKNPQISRQPAQWPLLRPPGPRMPLRK